MPVIVREAAISLLLQSYGEVVFRFQVLMQGEDEERRGTRLSLRETLNKVVLQRYLPLILLLHPRFDAER